MLTSDIISKFEIYVDDGTELSSSEELDLANKIYRKICNERPWSWLFKSTTGSISSGSITLPTDFAYLTSKDEEDYKCVFVGTNYRPVKLINYNQRRLYQSQDVAYIDPTDSKIKFIITPTETTYEFDYIKVPVDLTLITSPIFPARFHDIIYHGMASDDYMIQQFDKARSYANENQSKYVSILKDMAFNDAMLLQN